MHNGGDINTVYTGNKNERERLIWFTSYGL